MARCSRGRAFAALWARVPGLRWAGRLFRPRLPVLALEIEIVYAGFLRVRLWLQRRIGDGSAAHGYPRWLERELRADHAGEAGAVAIYRGIALSARSPQLFAFAQRHAQTERRHLDLMTQLVPPAQRSRLLPLWRAAGFVTGVVPALLGERAVYATIDAVEDFVVRHYTAQIERLAPCRQWEMLSATLEAVVTTSAHTATRLAMRFRPRAGR